MDYLSLLVCPVCDPPGLFVSPTTLHCGHTVCASHLLPDDPPLCPLPTCHSQLPQINLPSHVSFFPAPPDPVQNRAPAQPRVDITITKIISLLRRAQAWLGDPDASSPASTLRPRKRRKMSDWRPTADAWQGRFEKDLLSEVTCEICFMLLYHPVTTPCQHVCPPSSPPLPPATNPNQSFCSKCLQRSLDHSTACPLCRKDLPGYAYFQDHPSNVTLLSIILRAFPETYADRAQQINEEEKDARLDTPIFICQLSFPGMPTLLHFFEPRYRLMLRRCLESPHPRFGMVMPPRAGEGNDYGTMLEIKSVQMLADGRSMVETWGAHRFRILERGQLDGYTVGRIERFVSSLAFHTLPDMFVGSTIIWKSWMRMR